MMNIAGSGGAEAPPPPPDMSIPEAENQVRLGLGRAARALYSVK
jgi:hypothetical protein